MKLDRSELVKYERERIAEEARERDRAYADDLRRRARAGEPAAIIEYAMWKRAHATQRAAAAGYEPWIEKIARNTRRRR